MEYNFTKYQNNNLKIFFDKEDNLKFDLQDYYIKFLNKEKCKIMTKNIIFLML